MEPIDEARKVMEQCLAESTEANKLAMQMEHMPGQEKLTASLTMHSRFMKKAYDKYHSLIGKKINRSAPYNTLQKVVKPKMNQFYLDKKVASGIVKSTAPVKPKAKPKKDNVWEI